MERLGERPSPLLVTESSQIDRLPDNLIPGLGPQPSRNVSGPATQSFGKPKFVSSATKASRHTMCGILFRMLAIVGEPRKRRNVTPRWWRFPVESNNFRERQIAAHSSNGFEEIKSNLLNLLNSPSDTTSFIRESDEFYSCHSWPVQVRLWNPLHDSWVWHRSEREIAVLVR